MSGFTGIVSSDGNTPDRSLLERIAAHLAFRGPDATHISTQPGAGFCFTFLRTGPAPQSPTQPCSLDGRIWLLGDVRLDARSDLQRKLEQSGESVPAGVTDEELVLHAWRLWGEQGLTELFGDFSFALWHADTQRLWCVRDLMGSRPFYYALAGGRLCYSNTLETLLLLPNISAALNREFIGDFLLQECSSVPANTVYQEISRLPPGHSLEYAHGELRLRRYIALPIEEPLWLKRPQEYVERFQAVLKQAVCDRLPNGLSAIFLSGGLDSTSIAAVATKNSAAPGLLRAYTIDCQPLFDDQEGRLASVVAESLGMPIEILSAASCLPYEGWDDPHLRTPEPCHEPFLRLGRLQYQDAACHARIAWSGYGGDDLLTGQAWPQLIYLLRRWRFATIAKTFGEYTIRHGRIPPLRGGFRARLHRWMGRTVPVAEYPPWLEPQFAREQHLHERWLELQKSAASSHPLHPIGYAGLTNDYWSRVFEAEDAAWTGTVIELRTPLLDSRVLRYLLRVPPVPWSMDKSLLREAMRDLLPEAIRLRSKTPLLGDLLEAHLRSGKWSPLPLPPPALDVVSFVDWKQLGATLASCAGSSLWAALRPVSLSHWLKKVENERRIR